MDGMIESVVTYLQMTVPPTAPPPPKPLGNLAILRAEKPNVAFYRFLYDGVGAMWRWYMRRAMRDAELAEIIEDDGVEVYVLYDGGVPAGYFELDLRRMPEIELAYFGLMPEFVGRGFGPLLLRQAIDTAWARGPERLWVHTCTEDHPKALAVYQKAGFQVYDQETHVIADPRIAYPEFDWPVPPEGV